MLIDWFTVIAQAINFLILVWLLKRFLYKPILRAIDEREKRIADQLQQAEAGMAEAKKERDEFQRKNTEFDQQRQALVSQAEEEARRQSQQALDEARNAAAVLSKKLHESLQSDALNLNGSLVRRARKEVFAISRKALTDLADTNLEERIAEVFVHHLRELNGDAKQRLVAAVDTTVAPLMVRSAFALPQPQRVAIENAVKEILSSRAQVQFEAEPDLISGIELAAGGQKVAWSIDDYLTTMEKDVAELLKSDSKARSTTQPNPQPKADEHARQ